MESDIDLSGFDESYAQTAPPPAKQPDHYQHIPDGIFDADIVDAKLSVTVTTSRPIVLWSLRIRGPEAAGHMLYKNRVVTEKTLPWLKEDLEKSGLRLDRLSDLNHRVAEMIGRPVTIEKRTKDGRSQVYFRWPKQREASAGDN